MSRISKEQTKDKERGWQEKEERALEEMKQGEEGGGMCKWGMGRKVENGIKKGENKDNVKKAFNA